MHLLHNKARGNINSCYQKGVMLAIIRNKLLMGCVIELQTSKEKLTLSLTGWCRYRRDNYDQIKTTTIKTHREDSIRQPAVQN